MVLHDIILIYFSHVEAIMKLEKLKNKGIPIRKAIRCTDDIRRLLYVDKYQRSRADIDLLHVRKVVESQKYDCLELVH